MIAVALLSFATRGYKEMFNYLQSILKKSLKPIVEKIIPGDFTVSCFNYDRHLNCDRHLNNYFFHNCIF